MAEAAPRWAAVGCSRRGNASPCSTPASTSPDRLMKNVADAWSKTCADEMLLSVAITAVSLVWTRATRRSGMAMAARIVVIATTISSSIRVNSRLRMKSTAYSRTRKVGNARRSCHESIEGLSRNPTAWCPTSRPTRFGAQPSGLRGLHCTSTDTIGRVPVLGSRPCKTLRLAETVTKSVWLAPPVEGLGGQQLLPVRQVVLKS
jgi:hypothetical protein